MKSPFTIDQWVAGFASIGAFAFSMNSQINAKLDERQLKSEAQHQAAMIYKQMDDNKADLTKRLDRMETKQDQMIEMLSRRR